MRTQDLVDGKHLLVCRVCQAHVPGSATVVDQLDGAPCLVTRCAGPPAALARASPTTSTAASSARHEVQRVIAREHTSLLDDELRLEYENGFKGREDRPNAPNVLVATPTLEMGIDIGDLSTVMLASLPRSVASYLQRVGRAGRLTGSALNLAFVSGRGEQLPRLGDPLSMINGEVRPPGDVPRRRRDPAPAVPRLAGRPAGARRPTACTPSWPRARSAASSPAAYLHAIALDAEEDLIDGGSHLEHFLLAFPTLKEPARAMLREWVTRSGTVELTSPLAERLLAGVAEVAAGSRDPRSPDHRDRGGDPRPQAPRRTARRC